MWSCKLCDAWNSATSQMCKGCGVPYSFVTNPEDWWQCSNMNCCRFNSVDMTKCCFCDLPVTGSLSASDESAVVRDRAESTDHALEGATAGDSESQLHEVELETAWECEKCCALNSLEVYRCSSCDAIKPIFQHKLRLPRVRKGTVSTPSSKPAEESRRCATDWWNSQECEAVFGVSASQNVHLPTVTPACTSLEQLSIGAQEEVMEFPDTECRLVLVGKTGHGKSATASTIVGQQGCFLASNHFGSLTKNCQYKSIERFGIQLEKAEHRYVVFDNTASKEAKDKQVQELLTIVTKLVSDNFGQPFTNNLLQEMDKCIQEREKELRRDHRPRKGRVSSLHYRRMARGEIVKEQPLLQRIKKIALPMLKVAGEIAVGLLFFLLL